MQARSRGAGEAAYITFDPLTSEAVPLPDDCQFVVAHSTKISNKAETAVVHYNLRVVECRLAAVLLAIRLGYPISEARQLRSLHVRRPLLWLHPMHHPLPKTQSFLYVVLVTVPSRPSNRTWPTRRTLRRRIVRAEVPVRKK